MFPNYHPPYPSRFHPQIWSWVGESAVSKCPAAGTTEITEPQVGEVINRLKMHAFRRVPTWFCPRVKISVLSAVTVDTVDIVLGVWSWRNCSGLCLFRPACLLAWAAWESRDRKNWDHICIVQITCLQGPISSTTKQGASGSLSWSALDTLELEASERRWKVKPLRKWLVPIYPQHSN